VEFRVFGDLSNGCQARQGLRAMAERQAAQSRRRVGPQRLDESTPPGSGARQLKSEKKFKAVFEAAVDGIAVADAQTRTLLFANEAFCKALGYGKEQIQSLTLDDIHPRDSLRDVRRQFQGQANGEFSLVHNIAVKRKDGSVFYADINSAPLEIGGRRCLVGVFRENTQCIKLMSLIAEREARYRSLVEALPQKIFVKNRDLAYVSCNDNYASDLGIKAREIAGRTDFDFFPKKLAEKYRADDRKIINSGETREIEERYVHAGRQRWVRTIKSPVTGADGGVIGVVGVFWDVTDRKALEDRHHEVERRLEGIFSCSTDGIVYCGLEGVFLEVNDAFCGITGYSREELVGKKSFWDLTPAAYQQGDRQAVKELMSRGRPVELEKEYIRKDGGKIPVFVTGFVVKGSGGQSSGLGAVIKDTSANKKAEAEANKAREQLERFREHMVNTERLASLGTLSATVAHELSQPLTALGLELEEVQEKMEQSGFDNVSKRITKARQALSAAVSIAERFRTFARRSSLPDTAPQDIGETAQRIIKLLNGKAAAARVALRLRSIKGLPAVRCDQADIEQLFFAILQNAVEAADGHKKCSVTISGRQLGKQALEVLFDDTCGGIRPENIGRIFDPFFSTKPRGKGTGLGLCIARQIASRYGGKITVESTMGKGATFRVTLPV